MAKFHIVKEVEAKNLKEAIKKEKVAVIKKVVEVELPEVTEIGY